MAAIHELVEEQDYGVVRDCIQRDPSIVCLPDALGNHPLHIAADAGDIEIVKLLIDSGADVNARGDALRTPLHFAASAGLADVALFLAQRGADLAALDSAHRSPLYCAAQGQLDRTDVASVLLEHHTPLDLNAAVWLLNAHELQELLANGHGVKSAPDPTRLAFDAVMRGDSEILTALLDFGASPDGAPQHRPIIGALARPELLQTLLKRGADVTVKDSWGKSLLEAAKQAGVSNDVIILLRGHGAT